MTATLDQAAADPQQIIVELQRQLDERTRQLDACRAELAARNSEFGERIEHQSATIDVLKVMSASPGDPQPVFDLIVRRARDLCNTASATLFEFDGELVHFSSVVRDGSYGTPDTVEAYERLFPMVPTRGSIMCRAILDRQTIHVRDMASEPGVSAAVRNLGSKSQISLPLLRDGAAIGAVTLSSGEVGGFSDSQVALLQTFAEQAVIAITSAETYRELQQRTGALQELLEYQTATSDVLNVISRSTADVQPVLDTVVETAARLCGSEIAAIAIREGEVYRYVSMSTSAAEPEYWAILRQRRIVPGRDSVTARVALEGRVVHVADIRADPDYASPEALASGRRTQLGVPLLRDSEPIGIIMLSRKRVEPYTDRQIELVRTFADQAVIAIENARLLGELQQRTDELAARNSEFGERIEHQSATIDVLKAMSASPGDPQPVFDLIVRRARDLCNSKQAALFEFDGELVHLRSRVGVEAYGKPEVSEAYQRLFPMVPTRGSLSCRAILDRQIIHVRDMATAPGVSAAVRNIGAKSQISLPLLRDGVAIGALALTSAEIGGFSDSQVALLQTFAEQAVIAVTSAETYRELQQRTADLQESLEYQTATSDVLKVISRSTFDLSPVLEYVVETAIRLCRAHMGSIFRLEDGIYRWAVGYGLDPAYREIEERNPITPGTGTLVGRVALEGRALQIADALSDPDYAVKDEAQVTRARTMLGVPLLREGAPVGVIAMARDRVEPFSDKEIALVTTFADQAVIAIENARLLTEQREALEQQTATAEVLRVISGSATDLQPVFEAITARAAKLCEAEFSAVARFENGLLHLVAVSNLLPDEARAFHSLFPRPPTRGFVMGRAFVEGHTVHIEDVLADPDYDPRTREVLQSLTGYRSFFGVPMLRDGKPIGVIGCARRAVKPFTAAQLELVSTFADQAVIAIENARLFNDLRDRTDELAQRQAELRVTFDNMADGVVMFDEELRLAAWNRNFQQIVDLPDDFLGVPQSYSDYIRYLAKRGEFGEVDPEAEIRRLRERFGDHYSFERARPDGRVIEVRHNPVPSGGFVLIYADITERKRSEAEIRAARDAAEEASRTIEAAYQELKAAQARLVQAEKMASLGQLTAGIAHEIKNPLNFVNNFAGLSVELLDELKEAAAPALAALDGDNLAEVDEIVAMLTGNLEKIAEHGRRADGIVKSMLEHSRGESGERRPIDLNNLVEEALNLAYHGARAQDQSFNIALERDFAAAIAPIELVPQDVTRVLLNLIGNGFYAATKRLKESAEPGFRPALTVTTRDLGEAVEIRVRDNGAGIMPEIRDKLFQPFFTTKPTGEGTGLGLSISYDIVTQQHGGTIAVDSRVGEFTEFAIHLPRTRGMAPTATTIEAAAARLTA